MVYKLTLLWLLRDWQASHIAR